MKSAEIRSERRNRRRKGIRKRVIGTPMRPRLAVHRSLHHMYAQIIDDMAGRTIAAASTRDSSLGLSATGNADAAAAVGRAIAQRAKEKGLSDVVFDRGGHRFHGRVKALADAARKEGLQF